MSSFFNKIQKIAGNLWEANVSLLTFALSFLAIIAIRVFIEQFIAKSVPVSVFEIVIEYIHDIYFFSTAFILIWLLVSGILKINPRRSAYIFLWGLFLIPIPPLLDMIKTGGEVYWSFYILSSLPNLFGHFFTFFGQLPSGIVYFGTKIIFFAAIIFISGVIFLKTRNIFKSVLGALGTYVILFFMGTLPTLAYFFWSVISGVQKIAEIKSFHIAQFFGASPKIFGFIPSVSKYTFVYNLDFVFFPFLIFLLLVLFFLIDKKKLWAVAKNSRLPQIFYHSGLFFVGIGLGYLGYPQNFNLDVFSALAVLTLLLSIWLAWIASVIVNDIYDFQIDGVSNPERPLPKKVFSICQYSHLGILCFILSIIGAVSVGLPFAILILIYQILAWFYSAPPFRLKKFPGVATFFSALASLMILFLGYILLSDGQTINTLSPRIIFLLLISYTISLPIKDFKDIKGDKAYGIWTFPVLLGEKKARLILAVSVFVSFILSVFLLNELRLFWWAVLFGTLAFLVVVSEKIKANRFFWLVLGLVFSYGLILAKVVFL